MADPAAKDLTDLYRALTQLPHRQRLLVVLRYYLDFSFEEMGQTLDISAQAAKSRLTASCTGCGWRCPGSWRMNERDFRRRVRAVLGEPPGHASAVQRLEGRLADSLRSAARAERHHPRGMTLVAGALALLTVAALLAPQIASRTRGPKPTPTTSPASKGARHDEPRPEIRLQHVLAGRCKWSTR